MSKEKDRAYENFRTFGQLKPQNLAIIWLMPQSCAQAAWELLGETFGTEKGVRTLRASGMLDLILNKVDRYRWEEMGSAWPHLTVGELQTVLLRAARSHDWWGRDVAHIMELVLERSECEAGDVVFIMKNVTTLRENLFPELVRRGPGITHLIHCLGMREVWARAFDEIIRREDWDLPPPWCCSRSFGDLRGSFATFETKHLPLSKLAELLAWQYRKGILRVDELSVLADQKGYKLAARRALKELGINPA